MSRPDWDESDPFDDEGGELFADGGEAFAASPEPEPSPPSLPLSSPAPSAPTLAARVETRPKRRSPPSPSSPRRMRVRPMPGSMRSRWPDVVSCILTLADGRQVVFVRP